MPTLARIQISRFFGWTRGPLKKNKSGFWVDWKDYGVLSSRNILLKKSKLVFS